MKKITTKKAKATKLVRPKQPRRTAVKPTNGDRATVRRIRKPASPQPAPITMEPATERESVTLPSPPQPTIDFEREKPLIVDPIINPVSMEVSHAFGVRVEKYTPERRDKRQAVLVFQPGMFSGNLIFDKTCRWLGDLGYQSYVVIPRNHGSGPAIGNPGWTSIDDYAHDLHRFIRSLNEPVVLIGHSAGSIVANQVMQENRGQVKGFASLMGAPYRWAIPSLKCLNRLPRYLWRMLAKKTFKLSLEDARALMFNRISDPDTIIKAWEEMREESTLVALEIVRGKYRFIKPHCKWMLLKARYDEMVPHRWWTYQGMRCPWIAKANTSHMFMYDDNWQEVPEHIDKWFERNFPES